MKNDKDPHEVDGVSWTMMFVVMVLACIVGTGLSELIVWAMR